MAHVIYKYPIKIVDEQKISMPLGAEILCVQVQNNIPCIWARHPIPYIGEYQTRSIYIFGTGHEIEYDNLTYIGTFQMSEGAFVGHVFEYID